MKLNQVPDLYDPDSFEPYDAGVECQNTYLNRDILYHTHSQMAPCMMKKISALDLSVMEGIAKNKWSGCWTYSNGSKYYYVEGVLSSREECFNSLTPEQQETILWEMDEW